MKKELLLLFVIVTFLFSSGCSNKKDITSSSSNVSEVSEATIQSSSIIPAEVSSQYTDSSASSVSQSIPKPDTSPVINNDSFGIPDPVLYKAILSALNKQPGMKLTQNEALTLSFLNYGFHTEKIKDISGIGYLKNLTFLHLAENEITDFSPVLDLKKLKSLNLSGNKISDITAASYLTGLDVLNLAYNTISDVSPLSNLKNLKELGLWYNKIKNITPLLGLTNLSMLSLEGNSLNMSESVTVNAVNILKERIKYFALGLQGLDKSRKYSEVNLYIGKQQTLDSFSNITYTTVTLNGTPMELEKFYHIEEPGSYTLYLVDNLKTEYQFKFTIEAE